jgi:hypothetical protein
VPKVLCFKADTPSRLNSFSWQCVIEIYWDNYINRDLQVKERMHKIYPIQSTLSN